MDDRKIKEGRLDKNTIAHILGETGSGGKIIKIKPEEPDWMCERCQHSCFRIGLQDAMATGPNGQKMVIENLQNIIVHCHDMGIDVYSKTQDTDGNLVPGSIRGIIECDEFEEADLEDDFKPAIEDDIDNDDADKDKDD